MRISSPKVHQGPTSLKRTKVALFKGMRPLFTNQQQISATQRILSSTCSTSCIYCDIWKLAALIASHVPLAARYNLHSSTPTASPTSSRPSSPWLSPIYPTASQSTPYAHILSASRKIEAQIQLQRSQLNSILSICTVSGADECEGLWIAHDRCSAALEDLLDQEEDLEEALLEDIQEQQTTAYDYDYNYGYGYASQYSYPDTKGYAYPQERRPSFVDVAI
ncbi:hypothetical protein LTR99_009114 [Exophiala xenobiotica]|uniref:Uncharacterized protein n=1 Tax=Vermiconidia calcicola TaxID=1690605 RepID=A0AAV9Q0N6_9PEZI|nr:hypothetical protein LTR47_006028 [Exophiala xenobiotica]KAK5532380.1 hypothetical protein LTR25_007913 [Vermiconidia calcicola]KAK5541918.1 hypothetical protein LTR23_005520 [Chaetothyriales sp. CCFEE 6169]KAK5255461.1 hypothetical protein LTS06_000482 [Exophiala xenobiotica]KAK5264908.1 hypothetical protein LTR96_009707 [Exophiala xenobiotica]